MDIERFMQGYKAESLTLTPIMLKRLTITGATLRAQSKEAKAAIADGVRGEVWPLVEAGKIRPIVHATFPLEDARKAHELMETSSHSGKILLTTGR